MTVPAETPRPNGPFLKSCQYRDDSVDSPLYATDEFRMYCFKVLPCAKRFQHNWQTCPFAHPGEKARRRCVRSHHYAATPCPHKQQNEDCPLGDACGNSHSVFEFWLHPQTYRTQLCNDAGNCKRKICFFAHSLGELRMPALSPGQTAAAAAAAVEGQLPVLAVSSSSVLVGGEGLLQPVMSPSSSVSDMSSTMVNSSSNTVMSSSCLGWMSAHQSPHLTKTTSAAAAAATITSAPQKPWEAILPHRAAPLDNSINVVSLKQELQLLQQQQQLLQPQASAAVDISALPAVTLNNTDLAQLVSQLSVQPLDTSLTAVAAPAAVNYTTDVSLMPGVAYMLPAGTLSLNQSAAAPVAAAATAAVTPATHVDVNSYLGQGPHHLLAAPSQLGVNDVSHLVQLQPALLPQTAATGAWMMCPTATSATADSLIGNTATTTTAMMMQQQQVMMMQLGMKF